MMGHRPNRAQVAVLRANRRMDLEAAKQKTEAKKREWREIVCEVVRVERIAEERIGWRKKDKQ